MTEPEKESQERLLSDSRHTEIPLLDSAALFAGRSEIHIRHEGQIYRLRATRNGKLVMNK